MGRAGSGLVYAFPNCDTKSVMTLLSAAEARLLSDAAASTRECATGAMRVAQLDASRLEAEYANILTEQVNEAVRAAPLGFRQAVAV